MGFLKKLFGGESRSSGGTDSEGFFFYVQCDKCDERVRLRIHKHHDLNQADEGFIWHKTIVDSRCFRPMPTVVHFDARYQLVNADIDGGHVISQAEYEAAEVSETTDADQPQS